MTHTRLSCSVAHAALCVISLFAAPATYAQSYKYFRIGNPNDVQTKPTSGIAMMGGGADLDEAFRWLCNKGNGGDFLILRARGDDDYNSYVNGLCNANSVATLIVPDRSAAEDPAVAAIIRKAEVNFHRGRRSGQLPPRMERNSGAGRDQ